MIAIETLKSQLTTSASSERLRHPAAIAAVTEGHSKPIFFCDVIYEILCLSFFSSSKFESRFRDECHA